MTTLPPKLTERQIYQIVTAAIPLSELAPHLKTGRNVFCPFHPDEAGGKTSAKLYEDHDGEHLYCYSCRRQYSSYHYLLRVMRYSPLKYLEDTLPPDRFQYLITHPPQSGQNIVKYTLPDEAVSAWHANGDLEQFITSVYTSVSLPLA